MHTIIRILSIIFLTLTINFAYAKNDKLTIGLDWFINPDHAPLIIAKKRGFFKEVGLDVEMIEPADPNDPPKAQVDYSLSYGIGQIPSRLYFAVLWPGKQGINYTTEYYDTFTGWTFLSEREGDGVNLNFDYTIVDFLPWGVTRVISEWVNW